MKLMDIYFILLSHGYCCRRLGLASTAPSTWLRKLAYVVTISLRYPLALRTTNFRRPRASGDPEQSLLPGMNRGRSIAA